MFGRITNRELREINNVKFENVLWKLPVCGHICDYLEIHPLLKEFMKSMYTYSHLFEPSVSNEDIELFMRDNNELKFPTTYKVKMIKNKKAYDDLSYEYVISNDRQKIKEKFINYMIAKGYVLKK